MRPHRIFIAINLPQEAKTKLLAYQEKWPELPARWTTKENLHLTLAFLGNTSDTELAEVCEVIHRVGERHKPFTLTVNRIAYDSPRLRSGQAAKMIWALIEKSPQLLALQKDVVQTLHAEEDPSTSLLSTRVEALESGASQPFTPHLTLARLRSFELQRMEAEELPEINVEISVSFKVQSIEVMESKPKRSGSQYSIYESISLKKSAP